MLPAVHGVLPRTTGTTKRLLTDVVNTATSSQDVELQTVPDKEAAAAPSETQDSPPQTIPNLSPKVSTVTVKRGLSGLLELQTMDKENTRSKFKSKNQVSDLPPPEGTPSLSPKEQRKAKLREDLAALQKKQSELKAKNLVRGDSHTSLKENRSQIEANEVQLSYTESEITAKEKEISQIPSPSPTKQLRARLKRELADLQAQQTALELKHRKKVLDVQWTIHLKEIEKKIAAKEEELAKANEKFYEKSFYEWAFVAGMIGSLSECINEFFPTLNPHSADFTKWNMWNFIAPISLLVIGIILLSIGFVCKRNRPGGTLDKMLNGFYGLGVTFIIGGVDGVGITAFDHSFNGIGPFSFFLACGIIAVVGFIAVIVRYLINGRKLDGKFYASHEWNFGFKGCVIAFGLVPCAHMLFTTLLKTRGVENVFLQYFLTPLLVFVFGAGFVVNACAQRRGLCGDKSGPAPIEMGPMGANLVQL